MRDVMIIHVIHSLKGGVASVALNLIKRQLADGYCVGVAYAINGDGVLDLIDDQVELYQVSSPKYPGQNMLFGFNIMAIYQHFKRNNNEKRIIIHAHNVETVGLFGISKKIPLLCTVHGTRGKDKNLRTELSDFLCRTIMKRIRERKGYVVCVSNSVKTYWDKKDNIGLRVIYNGCETSGVVRIPHDGFIVGYIGDISYAKGIDILLEAIAYLPEDIQKKMHMIMAGREKDIKATEIQEFFDHKNLHIALDFKGFIPNASESINPLLDVLVLPSRNEGLSVCLIEAMSFGVPLIGMNVGGIPEIIDNGENGYLVENAKQLAGKIELLFRDAKVAARLSANGLIKYNELFTAQIMYMQYCEIYDRL